MDKTRQKLLLILLLLPTVMIFDSSFVKESNAEPNTSFIRNFSSNVLLSTSDQNYSQHVEPTLAIGPNNQLYVGWKNAQYPYSGGLGVSFTKSLDNGTTWSIPLSMPSNATANRWKSDPWLQVYNNTIYYSYIDYIDPSWSNSTSQITMARSTDQGLTWKTSKASDNKYFSDKEAFTISNNGTIYLTYDDINIYSGVGNVMLSKSVDGGKTFTDISRVNEYANEKILGPYPAVSSNQTLFVAWFKIGSNDTNGDVYYAHSSNGGKNFLKEFDLNPETNYGTYTSSDGHPAKTTIPVIKFDSHNRLYVLWAEDNQKWQIYLRYSDDFGLHWSAKIPIYKNLNVDQWLPDMAIDSNNNLHIVWYQESYNQYRPYYRELSFTGVNRSIITESNIIPVSSSFTASSFKRPGDYCTIRVDSNNIPHIVWTDGRTGKLNIYYAQGIPETGRSGSIAGFTYPLVLIPITIFIIVRKRNKNNSC